MMIIVKDFHTDDPANAFVAGIFSDPRDVGAYLSFLPTREPCVIINYDVHYPFYIWEIDHVFIAYQDNPIKPNGTVYTITADFEPPVPWTDYMGSLPHHHLGDDC